MIRDYIESFARRKGRISDRQQKGLDMLSEGQYTIDLQKVEVFKNARPLVVEIGFGMGADFLERAQMHPDVAFIGIDVYPPAIGNMVMNVHENGCKNVKILGQDAMQVLVDMPSGSIDALHLFFPDPWPKKRHHKRRMALQMHFHHHLFQALKTEGVFYFVSDWQPYVDDVEVLYDQLGWRQGAKPVIERACKSKYEKRGLRLDHEIKELIYAKPAQLLEWPGSVV